MEEIAVLDASSVMLPASAVEGLNGVQIEAMKQTVLTVNQNFKVAGSAIMGAAEELHRLKSIIPRGSWIKFLKSGALPIGEKTARDLEKAWSGWLMSYDGSDGSLAQLSARTMGRIAAASPDAQKKIKDKLKMNKKVTEEDITGKPAPKVGLKVENAILRDENIELKAKIKNLQELLKKNDIPLPF